MRAMAMAMVSAMIAGPAAASGVVEEHHGYTVADPYRHLESDDTSASWVEEQHRRTAAFFEAHGEGMDALTARLDELSQVGGVSSVRTRGKRTFYVKRTGTQEQGVLYVREGDSERVLLDPAAIEEGAKIALDWYHPSAKGELVAFGLSRDGSEVSVLHVLDVESGELHDLRIPNTRAASVAWLRDASGFYYTRYPEGDQYNRHVYFHRLGSDPKDDPHVFGKGLIERTDWPSVRLAEDGKTLFFSVSKGWSANEVWMLRDGEKEPTLVLGGEGQQALYGMPLLVDGKLVVSTNYEAPNFRVVSVDPKKPDPAEWKTLIAEREWPIQSLNWIGGKLIVGHLENAVSTLAVYEMNGKKVRDIELPGIGSVFSVSGSRKDERMVVGITSFLVPPTLYEGKVGEGKLREYVSVGVPPMEGVIVEQVEYPSYDGTWVPMFLVRSANAPKDRSNPTLLTGYGGFNVSLTPRFSTTALAWVEQGGIYALANLRGGSEKGEAWHHAGRLENKHQVFRDFEYAMRHLIREGWTQPDRLAITGGSNGGLLMGAMMTQAPELFRAAVGRVGLYDMIRFQHFLIAELWVDEYGSSANPDQVGYLLGYSPYHQVLPGVRYPAFLGLTARADSRVSWVHTAKFVAALQEVQAGDAPILFFMEEKAGHGQGKGRSDRVQEEAMMLQFILSQLEPAAPTLESPKR